MNISVHYHVKKLTSNILTITLANFKVFKILTQQHNNRLTSGYRNVTLSSLKLTKFYRKMCTCAFQIEMFTCVPSLFNTRALTLSVCPFSFIIFWHVLGSQTLSAFSVEPETMTVPGGFIAKLYMECLFSWRFEAITKICGFLYQCTVYKGLSCNRSLHESSTAMVSTFTIANTEIYIIKETYKIMLYQ